MQRPKIQIIIILILQNKFFLRTKHQNKIYRYFLSCSQPLTVNAISQINITYQYSIIFFVQMKADQQNHSFISDDSYISHIDKDYFKNISFFSKQFCMPKQIKLQDGFEDEINNKGDGLLIVERDDIDDINPTSREVIDSALREFKQNGQDNVKFINGDGLISMFKHRHDLPIHPRVAICVTVYSQDKLSLKRTLDGIKSNYKVFLEEAGILSHQIVVIVIFDGIQKVNNSPDSEQNMVSIFQDFDLMNGFRKKQYMMAKRGLQDDKKETKQIIIDDQFQLQNFDDEMIFTEQQLNQLNDSLFQTQYTRYIEMCQLIKYIKELSKKDIQKLSINQMPKKIRVFFLDRARKFMMEHNINNVTEDDDQLQKYLEDNMARQKLQMLKFQSIKQAQKVAKDYIQSRQSTAILYQIALPIDNDLSEEQKRKASQDPKLRFHQLGQKMYTFFAVKHANSGKLSSHLWFFQGFCNIIQPDVCILIDCGLKTNQNAIFKMWAHIETFKTSCGGVCGYMSLNIENPCDDLGYRTDDFDQNKVDCLTQLTSNFFDIQKAQMFEYHFAHMIDKPFQSWFGYIHVLPGAFSAYNWDALKHQQIKIKKRVRQNGKKTVRNISEKAIKQKQKGQILRKYLKTVIYNQTLDDIKQANMYLAQDRILCLEIYSKKNHHFNLEYLPDAESNVDPVTSLIRLLGQRKRWINGSWFALEYVLQNRKRVSESQHNSWQKFKFRSNMFYSGFNKALSYIGISLFFIILHFMIQQFAQNQFLSSLQNSLDLKTQQQLNKAKVFYGFFSLRSLVNNLVGIVDFCYVLAIGVTIYYSLTVNRHTDQSKRIFNFITTIFGIYGVLSVVLVFYNFFSTVISKVNGTYQILDSFIQSTGSLNVDLFMYLLGVIVIVHLLMIIITFDLQKYFEIIISLPSYFFYVPTYIHSLFIYAFCRIDDLSWGTKGLDSDNQKKESVIATKFKNQKLRFVFRWIATNVAFCLFCISLSNNKIFQTGLIWAITFYVIIVLLLRALFAVIYLIKYYWIIAKYVKNTTLSERKRIQRYNAGCIIRNNLNMYVEQVKNTSLPEHIEDLKEQLKNQSRLNKILDQQEYNIIQNLEQRSRIFQSAYQRSKSIKSIKSIKKDNSEDKQINLEVDQNRSRNSGSRRLNISNKKVYANVHDNKPILPQIFSSSNKYKNQSIQYQDIVKLAELNKLREKVYKHKTHQLHSRIVQQKEDEDEQNLMPAQTKAVFSTNPQIEEEQKFDMQKMKNPAKKQSILIED